MSPWGNVADLNPRGLTWSAALVRGGQGSRNQAMAIGHGGKNRGPRRSEPPEGPCLC